MRILIVLLLPLLGVACAHLNMKQPKVSLASIGLRDSTVLEGTLDVKLLVENPNDFTFDIDRFSYRLFLNDRQIATEDVAKPVHLIAAQSTEVTLPVRIRYAEVFRTISDVMSAGQTRYRIEGEAKSGWIKTPFRREGEIKLKAMR